MQKTRIKSIIFRAVGLILCILPVTSAVLCYFPLWKNQGGGAVVSGIAVLLLIPSVAPLLNFLKEKLRSPSVKTLWLIFFIIFSALSAIADEMVVISFVGLVSNLLGSVFFALAKRGSENEK